MALFHKCIDVNKKTSLALPLLRPTAALVVKNGDRGEKGAVKIADCQRKRKRLGRTRKHARHVKALGPFVLILSNADFLWVAEVAKRASVRSCVNVYMCVSVYAVCVCMCVCG